MACPRPHNQPNPPTMPPTRSRQASLSQLLSSAKRLTTGRPREANGPSELRARESCIRACDNGVRRHAAWTGAGDADCRLKATAPSPALSREHRGRADQKGSKSTRENHHPLMDYPVPSFPCPQFACPQFACPQFACPQHRRLSFNASRHPRPCYPTSRRCCGPACRTGTRAPAPAVDPPVQVATVIIHQVTRLP
jgi:hypothetical protein